MKSTQLCAGVVERTESRRKIRAIFECLELRLGVRIVVRHLRPGMRLRHTECGEQERDRLRRHRRAAAALRRRARSRCPSERLGGPVVRRQVRPKSCENFFGASTMSSARSSTAICCVRDRRDWAAVPEAWSDPAIHRGDAPRARTPDATSTGLRAGGARRAARTHPQRSGSAICRRR